MQIKVLCSCGTKLAFDAEPIEGRMACAVICPNCQADITEGANAYIGQMITVAAEPAPNPAGGLSVTRKKAELHPSTPAAAPATTAPEATSEEDSFEAKRAKRLAEAQSKQAAQAQEWGKLAMIGRIAAIILITLVGAYGWYAFSGSKPKEYYSVKLGAGASSATARLKSPDELVVMDGAGVSLHDLKAGKPVWTVANKGGGETDIMSLLFERKSLLHVTGKYIWSVMDGKLQQIEAGTGTVKKETPVPGMITEFNPLGESLVIISRKSLTEYGVMVVNLADGETKSESVIVEPKKEVVAEVKEKTAKPATSGNLLKDELEPDDQQPLTAMNTLFTSAGERVIKWQIKLIKANLVQVKVMSDAAKQSKINSKTSAGSNPFAVAEEVFNDIKRSNGSQFRVRDDSTYEVALTGVFRENEPNWTGEVTGKPSIYSGQKINVIIANQEVILLSKDNKLLGRSKLNYPMGVKLGLSIRRQIRIPIVETEDTLYLWDKGTVTAFDLSTGNKKWDYALVGITSIIADGKGGLYVCGTTADASSIQYEENIKLQNRPRALFVKLDSRTGKLLWQGKEGANDVYQTGKFLYTTRGAGSTLSLMAGESTGSHTYIHRVNPRNGEIEWEMDYGDHVKEFNPEQNRLVIVTSDTVKVMKFLSL